MDTHELDHVLKALAAAKPRKERAGRDRRNGTHQERLVLHDVAATLGVILREASEMDGQANLGEEDRGRIRRIAALADRGKSLIVRKQDRMVNERRCADPNAALLGAVDMLGRTAGTQIRVLSDLQDPIWMVRGDPVLLERAVTNLVVNAEEAMPGGGEIILGSANVRFDEARARAAGLASGGSYVRISVTDTGEGIPDHVRPHIFRSCFSTKRERGCRGLGLTVVQETASDVGGAIRLEQGSRTTTFALYLPAVPRDDDPSGL